MKKKLNKIGILGGTFDPPHIGHLHISKVALAKLNLDKVIWVITKQNPLKQKSYLTIKTRIELAKNITKKESKIFVKYFENKVKSKNTFNLLKFLKKKNKNAKLFFLAGADNLMKFHKWRNWKQIPKLAKIVIFARIGYSTKVFNSIAAKSLEKKDWTYINSKKIKISSSLIRKF